MRINDMTVYLTDNGAAYCGAHLGSSAKHTGYDISGQKIMAVSPSVAKLALKEGWEVSCEQCGRKASLLIIAEG
jgi:hypothetical protein